MSEQAEATTDTPVETQVEPIEPTAEARPEPAVEPIEESEPAADPEPAVEPAPAAEPEPAKETAAAPEIDPGSQKFGAEFLAMKSAIDSGRYNDVNDQPDAMKIAYEGIQRLATDINLMQQQHAREIAALKGHTQQSQYWENFIAANPRVPLATAKAEFAKFQKEGMAEHKNAASADIHAKARMRDWAARVTKPAAAATTKAPTLTKSPVIKPGIAPVGAGGTRQDAPKPLSAAAAIAKHLGSAGNWRKAV